MSHEDEHSAWVCYDCIGEDYLSNVVAKSGTSHLCSYCKEEGASLTLEDIANRVEVAFDQHYHRTPDQPDAWQMTMLADKESSYNWYRDGESTVDAIRNAIDSSEEIASDIQEILSDRHSNFHSYSCGKETEFCDDAHYEEKGVDDSVWWDGWRQLEESLRSEARFFNRGAVEFLNRIFGGIDKLPTKDGRPLLVKVGPEVDISKLFRARVFQSDEKLCEALARPDIHLGNPPPKLAAAGRMNARGISVFYAATDIATAIAEVRPPVGSQVAVARFTIKRELSILDLTALDSVYEGGSIFDEGWITRLERAKFLGRLSKVMAKPVMPDDEAFDYLVTQAISDFLSSENDPIFNGIMFPSVQTEGDGLNVVLFRNSATVETIDIPPNTKVDVRTGMFGDDGWDPDYKVIELTEVKSYGDIEKERNIGMNLMLECTPPYMTINPSLKVDVDGIVVCVIKKAHYEFSPFNVSRSRIEDRWSHHAERVIQGEDF